jgi:hypothetical protein
MVCSLLKERVSTCAGDWIKAARLTASERHVQHLSASLLNAEQGQALQESLIIAQAGMLSHVTVATSMAGRGTDIILGGDPGQLLLLLLSSEFNALALDSDDAYKRDQRKVAYGSASSKAASEVQARSAAAPSTPRSPGGSPAACAGLCGAVCLTALPAQRLSADADARGIVCRRGRARGLLTATARLPRSWASGRSTSLPPRRATACWVHALPTRLTPTSRSSSARRSGIA